MSDLQRLYEEVIQHYGDCRATAAGIGDVWRHKLNTKGRLHSLEQLKYALTPGSMVLGDFYDFNLYVDPSVIDLKNPVTARIIELGESDFGNPLKDVNISGKRFSSKFVCNAAIATRIVERLQSLNIQYPNIMEIGSGVAVLLQIFKLYYGDKVTLFVVDLPETLVIQEWLLRNWFPAESYSYQSTQQPVTLMDGGINFINAHALGSLDIPVDVMVNTSSMQEMDADTADSYFAYAAENLSDNGFFYFENHFGHGNNATVEPTEHNLDRVFTTISADIISQFEMNNPYGAFQLILGKTKNAEDPEARRFVHRLLWNGFNSGLVPRNDDLVRELGALPQSASVTDIAESAGAVLHKYRVAFDLGSLNRLHGSVHLDSSHFLHSYSGRFHGSNGWQSSIKDFTASLWGARSALNRLMHDAITYPDACNVGAARHAAMDIGKSLVRAAGNVEDSESRTASIACFLMPLGETELGRDALMGCADRSKQRYWLLRFAHLLSDYGFHQEASSALDRIEDFHGLNPMFLAKAAEVRHFIGQEDQAKEILHWLLERVDRFSYMEVGALARASAIMNYPESAMEAFNTMVALPEASSRRETLEFLHIALLSLPQETGKKFVSTCLDQLGSEIEQPRARLLASILRCLVNDRGLEIEAVNEVQASLPKDYHSLGWAGHVLMRAGLERLAERCLEDSLSLLPDNFLHREFVGDVYFAAGNWQKASVNFEAALKLVPYVRHLTAKSLYCRLPESYRQVNLFSGPPGLEMIYQQSQDYYSDITPSVKPTIRFRMR